MSRSQWKLYRVITGNLGWVRSIAFDPSNRWTNWTNTRPCSLSKKHIHVSAGDDKQVKCWDLEQKKVIWTYHGHLSGVYCLSLHPDDKYLLTGGRDSVCRVWDIRTRDQKSVRTTALHPAGDCFASASFDNIEKFSLPEGEFLHNMSSKQNTIINAMAISNEGVMATGADNGTLYFWDWKSGHSFQQKRKIVQPGSGSYPLSFDITGSRLVTL
ncbi:conserved hypothetical protein [Ricinus communis]|uniref:Uncharacterized protein n=1 Tax=Ricinus communis TaxID=3988 RepID=B9SDY4_RICCO|nr:conserved hypothetical protein [Ricinus communis]